MIVREHNGTPTPGDPVTYLYYGEKDLLYAGSTMNWITRSGQHKKYRWYKDAIGVIVHIHESKRAMEDWEILLIHENNPIHNVMHRTYEIGSKEMPLRICWTCYWVSRVGMDPDALRCARGSQRAIFSLTSSYPGEIDCQGMPLFVLAAQMYGCVCPLGSKSHKWYEEMEDNDAQILRGYGRD